MKELLDAAIAAAHAAGKLQREHFGSGQARQRDAAA